jgi:uroporphyrinogen decarboxylase
MATVNGRERVLAALHGEAVDHVPISFWGHDYVAENSAEGLAEATLRRARQFDWDYLKPQSRAQSFAEMWGFTYTPSTVATQKYTATGIPLEGAADLERLLPADPTGGALGEQIQALRLVREGIGPDVPIIWTVFSPLMVARYLLQGEGTQLIDILRSEPTAVEAALEAITETLIGYVKECAQNGADGIFYATNLATRDRLTLEECARFQRPYDMRILAAVERLPFTVMHVCGQDALFDAFADYPVAAFSWAAGGSNPPLSEGHRRTGKASMGGVPAVLKGLTADDVAARVRHAVGEMQGCWLVLAPDCSIDIGTPHELLEAATRAARTSTPTVGA